MGCKNVFVDLQINVDIVINFFGLLLNGRYIKSQILLGFDDAVITEMDRDRNVGIQILKTVQVVGRMFAIISNLTAETPDQFFQLVFCRSSAAAKLMAPHTKHSTK